MRIRDEAPAARAASRCGTRPARMLLGTAGGVLGTTERHTAEASRAGHGFVIFDTADRVHICIRNGRSCVTATAARGKVDVATLASSLGANMMEHEKVPAIAEADGLDEVSAAQLDVCRALNADPMAYRHVGEAFRRYAAADEALMRAAKKMKGSRREAGCDTSGKADFKSTRPLDGGRL